MTISTGGLLCLFQFLSDPNKENRLKSIFITPKMAQEILAKMSKPNRPPSRSQIKLFKHLMLTGQWTNNHAESLMWDTNSKLHEGYGRLITLSELDGLVEGFWFNVLRNIPPDMIVNTNVRRRSIGDRYVFEGGLYDKKTPPKKIMAIASLAMNGINGTKHASPGDAEKAEVKFAIANAALIIETYQKSAKYGKEGGRYHVGWVAAFVRAFLSYGEDRVRHEFERFVKQEWRITQGPNDPLKRLHTRLHQFDVGSPGYNVYPYAVSAIRAALLGKTLELLRESSEDFPMVVEIDQNNLRPDAPTVNPTENLIKITSPKFKMTD